MLRGIQAHAMQCPVHSTSRSSTGFAAGILSGVHQRGVGHGLIGVRPSLRGRDRGRRGQQGLGRLGREEVRAQARQEARGAAAVDNADGPEPFAEVEEGQPEVRFPHQVCGAAPAGVAPDTAGLKYLPPLPCRRLKGQPGGAKEGGSSCSRPTTQATPSRPRVMRSTWPRCGFPQVCGAAPAGVAPDTAGITRPWCLAED